MTIYALHCSECGAATAYALTPFTSEQKSIQMQCYLCMHNICDVAAAFGKQDIASNTDLYALGQPTIEGGHDERMNWRSKCIDFMNRARNRRNAIYIAAGKHLRNAKG